MARTRSVSALKPKSKTSNTKFTVPVPRTGLFAFLAAFAGIVAAVPLMFAVMMPMVRQDVASAVSAANKHVVSVAPADDTLSCAQPSTSTAGVGGQGGGQVLGASTIATPPVGGQGGGMGGGGGNSTTTTYVHKLVNGVFTASSSISNTGPGSSNNVTTTQTATTTVNNNNDIDVNNVNVQKSETGDANVSDNTTGGAATTGDASNTNSTSLNLSVSN